MFYLPSQGPPIDLDRIHADAQAVPDALSMSWPGALGALLSQREGQGPLENEAYLQRLGRPLMEGASAVGSAIGTGVERALTPNAEGMNPLMLLGLTSMGIGAAVNNPSGPNPLLQFLQHQSQFGLQRQELALRQKHYADQAALDRAKIQALQEERRQKVLDTFIKLSTDMPPEMLPKFLPLLRPQVERDAPDMLDAFDAMRTSPENIRTGIAAIERHPLIQQEFARIDQSVPPKDQEKSKRDLLLNTSFQKQIEAYNVGEITSILSGLAPEQKAALKGVSFDDFIQGVQTFKDAKGQPIPPYLLQTLKSGHGDAMAVLSAYGVQTPKVSEKAAEATAAEQAKEPFKEKESARRSLTETQAGLLFSEFGVRPDEANPEQVAAALHEDELRQGRITEGKQRGEIRAKFTTEPLGDRAHLWLDAEGNAAPADMTRSQAAAEGRKPVSEGQLKSVATAKAALGRIPQYDSLVDKLLSKKVSTGLGDTVDTVANILQRGKTGLGVLLSQMAGDEDARQFQALEGLISTVARAAGEVGNLAYQERLDTIKATATKWDSKESGHAVMRQLETLLTDIIRTRGIPMPGSTSSEKRTITEDEIRAKIKGARQKAP